MGTNFNFIKSDIRTLLLKLLSERDMYGYQLIQTLKERSNNFISLKDGCVYPILHSLEKSNLINSYWVESQNGRKQKYYSLNENGKKILAKEEKELKKYISYVSSILGGVWFGNK